MPEADKFTALGAGNGFPACLLTGEEGDTEHDLAKVMHIFYNLHRMTVEGVIGVSDVWIDGIGEFGSNDPDIGLEPVERVCAFTQFTEVPSTGVVTGYRSGDANGQQAGSIRITPLSLPDSKHHIVVDILLNDYRFEPGVFYETDTYYSSNPLGLYEGVYEYYFKHEIDCGGVTLYGGSINFPSPSDEPEGPIPKVTGFEFYTYPA